MSKENLITKLEKGRAEFAYQKVLEVSKLNKELQKDYRSYVRKLPQMILSNGLGQTLAFVYSKKKKGNAYEFIYDQISQYLESENTMRISKEKGRDLVEWVIGLDSIQYRYATEEVLAFLNWLRRFAEGMIEEEKEGE